MDKLNTLKIFITVADQGSFAATAKLLGTNPSTISKAIDRLEKELQLNLLQRTTRKLRLSHAGERYYQTARMLIEELDACESALRNDNALPGGTLKINAPVSYGRLYLQTLIPKFSNLYPDINIEVTYDDAYIDIINKGFDLSIRTGTLQDNRLIAQKLSCIDVITCASPGLANKLSYAIKADTLEHFPWIRFRFKQTGRLLPIQLPQKRNKIINYDPPSQFIVDDGEAMIDFCVAGMGLIQVPHFLARHALLKKRIVPLIPTFSHADSGIYLLYPKRDYLPTRVRAFIEFLKSATQDLNETPDGTWARQLPTKQL